MTKELIEKFVEEHKRKDRRVRVHFKTRNTISGIFIITQDYNEMKSKNFWRIVSETRLDEWRHTKDPSVSRLFNGAEFTKLTDS